MDKTGGLIHKHDNLIRHGHCAKCIEIEQKRFGLKNGQNPKIHAYLVYSSIKNMNPLSAAKYFEIFLEKVYKQKYVWTIENMKYRNVECFLCGEQILSRKYVKGVDQRGLIASAHQRCFNKEMRHIAKMAIAYGKAGVNEDFGAEDVGFDSLS